MQSRLAKPTIDDKLQMIYALMDDLTAELIANYQEVDVEFHCQARKLVQNSYPEV